MKKLLSILLAVLCICTLLVLPTSAAPDPLAERFKEALGSLDLFFNFDIHYIVYAVNKTILNDLDALFEERTVSAEEYEETVARLFVSSDDLLVRIRAYDPMFVLYNETEQTYTISFPGGFGGVMEERTYLGYSAKGENQYEVFYQNITYGYLSDALPEGTDEAEYAENLDWPETIEYEGVVYHAGMGEYYTIVSYDDFGRKYTVEDNDGAIRLLACDDYTAEDLPESFDDTPVVETEPEATEPEATEPEGTEPEGTEPEATDSRPESSGEESLVTGDAVSEDASSDKPDDQKAEGCGSSVSGGALLLCLIGAAAVSIKRKED